MLPDELLLTLNDYLPCREFQIRALISLFNNPVTSPHSFVIHGLEATGKTLVTRETLKALDTPHAIIDSKECITGRQLLEQTIASASDAIATYHGIEFSDFGRCENLNTLKVHLGNLLAGDKRLVLVFDAIDHQREALPTLIPALARLGESIPSLSIVFIISVPSPRLYHTTGIPHIHFPPYTREESIQIMSLSPPRIFSDGLDPTVDYTEEEAAEDDAYVWGRFCGVVWDSFAKGAARDLVSFRNVCDKLWHPFTAPIREGIFGTRDFARLMVSRRPIFQNESVLVHGIVSSEETPTETAQKTHITHELPYYSKYILCASYLASFNPARQDPIFFMKSHEKKRKKKTGASTGKVSKHRKISRSMLAPSPFLLDRMLAILHAIVPHTVPASADLLAQIATLASLRLLIRAGAASADSIDAGSRWRINCGWEFIVALGRSVGLEIRDYLAGVQD